MSSETQQLGSRTLRDPRGAHLGIYGPARLGKSARAMILLFLDRKRFPGGIDIFTTRDNVQAWQEYAGPFPTTDNTYV